MHDDGVYLGLLMFDYPHLEALLSVEREKSLEGAARSQGVTKSALSQTIRLLEERMGAVVLNRETMSVTAFGARLCRHYEQVSLLENALFKKNPAYFAHIGPAQIPLTIGVADDALASWLTDLMCDTAVSKLNIAFDIDLLREDDLVRALKERRVCGALLTASEPIPGYAVHELGTYTTRAVTSPDFIEQHLAGGISYGTIKDVPLLRYALDDAQTERWFGQTFAGSPLPPAHIVPSAHGILNACLDGRAWGLCADILAKDYIQSGELVELVAGTGLAQELNWFASKEIYEAIGPLTQILKSALGNKSSLSREQA